MAKVIFFDDIDFGLKTYTGSDEVSTSGKWLDNGIYFTNPKSEDGQPKPHHIAHDSYIYTLGSNVKPGDEYSSKTEKSSYYISVISGISADPFNKEITYDTTKYDLSNIFDELSDMKRQILDILGRLNGQETVSSFTFSLSRTGITDSSLLNFVVGEPILAKITDIIPSSSKYSYFNIIESDYISKLDHTVGDDEDSFYFTTPKTTSVSASIITGPENTSQTSTIDNVTVSYATIYTYAYSCGKRIAGLNNVDINADVSLRNTFADIHNNMFGYLADIVMEETDSNIADSTIANKKLSDYYNVPSYKIYYNNSYTTTEGTSLLLTYAIKQQNKPTFINTRVDLDVQAYLVCYTVKTEEPDNLNNYKYAYNYAYITDITNATVNQYLGSNKTYYTCKNTCNGKDISGGPVADLDFVTNKPHRKDILITYTLNKPSGITVLKDNAAVESTLQLTIGTPVDLVVTLDNDSELHDSLKGITVAVTGDISVTVNDTSITSINSGDNIKVTANGSGSIMFGSINNISSTISVSLVAQEYSKYLVTIEKDADGTISGRRIVPLNEEKPYGIKLLEPGTIKNGDKANTEHLSIVEDFPPNKTDKNNPPIELNYFATTQEFSIFKNDIDDKNIELTAIKCTEETIDDIKYYMIKSTTGSSGFYNGETFYIQINKN